MAVVRGLLVNVVRVAGPPPALDQVLKQARLGETFIPMVPGAGRDHGGDWFEISLSDVSIRAQAASATGSFAPDYRHVDVVDGRSAGEVRGVLTGRLRRSPSPPAAPPPQEVRTPATGLPAAPTTAATGTTPPTDTGAPAPPLARGGAGASEVAAALPSASPAEWLPSQRPLGLADDAPTAVAEPMVAAPSRGGASTGSVMPEDAVVTRRDEGGPSGCGTGGCGCRSCAGLLLLLLLLMILCCGVVCCGPLSLLNLPSPEAYRPSVSSAEAEGCGVESCGEEGSGDGFDNDCDGVVDEDCACAPGMVEDCFPGKPARRGVGICTDGKQTCGADGTWGTCQGAIVPQPAVCNGLDNECDGGVASTHCPITCPASTDPRIADLDPFATRNFSGREMYSGVAQSWEWTVEGGPCDEFAHGLSSFELKYAETDTAQFTPLLSGDYKVRLKVTTSAGTTLGCEWVQHVRGKGLRVELCYPEAETQDLDLYLHRPGSTSDWFPNEAGVERSSEDLCDFTNCRAQSWTGTIAVDHVDWGFPSSPLSACELGPQGDVWRSVGHCGNPRLDIDNKGDDRRSGPENINVDAPRDGDTFRVMVQNYSGELAHPVVNVYCAGHRLVTYGSAPDSVRNFSGKDGPPGAMWRVVDITTRVSPDGSLRCVANGLHPPGQPRGYFITYDDGSY
jgi:hypothetical protein